MSEKQNYTPIAAPSDDVLAAIRRKTALSLPDDPSAAGLSAATIRRRFWEAICGADASVLAEMTRIINEANAVMSAFDGELGTVRRIYTTPPTSEVRSLESGENPEVNVSVKENTGSPVLHFDFAIPEGKQGKRGPSGVYVGSGEMPDDCNVQIDPEAEDFEYYEMAHEAGESRVKAMSQWGATRLFEQNKCTGYDELLGTVSGSAVRIEDASPIEHNMAVKVSGVDDVSAVKVQRYGKNLYSGGDIKTAALKDGFYIQEIEPIPAGKYYVSCILNSTDSDSTSSLVHFYSVNGSVANMLINRGVLQKKTVTFTKPVTKLYIYASNSAMLGKGDSITLTNMQIEVNGNTDYEPYIAPTEYTVNPDGTVEGVTSLSPTTTLMTDTEGAVIDVEYNRDINKAFDELKQAIISLGGNV